MSILVMVSALGAINGLIFTGSRVYSTLGGDYGLFAWLGKWNPRFGSPLGALLTQAVITLAMIGAVGTEVGRNTLNDGLQRAGLPPLPWSDYDGGFGTLVAGSAPVFWGFFLLSGLSLFALRERDPNIERPFKVPLFPLLPIIFCGTCFYMLYAAIDYAKMLALIGALPLIVGLPLYWISSKRANPEEPPASEPAA
jgi:amino acid transporter